LIFKITKLITLKCLVINLVFFYSRSFLLGFLDASLDKKPNVKRDTKNVTVVYTAIFSVNINLSPK